MKYIMFEDFSGEPLPVLFPDRIAHEEIRSQIPYTQILGAGYITLQDNNVLCSGESKALKEKARDEDGPIIAAHLKS
jgi:hypothetical protein